MTRRGVPPLAEAAIVDILTSTLKNVALAQRHGCSPSLISLVRLGRIHSQVRPDLPRQTRSRQFCSNCREWRDGECAFGFPDPLEEGLHFATDCLNFVRKEPAQRHPQSCADQ